jgi:hypothetical protein
MVSEVVTIACDHFTSVARSVSFAKRRPRPRVASRAGVALRSRPGDHGPVGLGGLDEGLDLPGSGAPGSDARLGRLIGATVRLTSVGATSLRCDFFMENGPPRIVTVRNCRKLRTVHKRENGGKSNCRAGRPIAPFHGPHCTGCQADTIDLRWIVLAKRYRLAALGWT